MNSRYPMQVQFMWGSVLHDVGAVATAQTKTSPCLTQPEEYESMLSLAELYDLTEDYSGWERGALVDRLREWHTIHSATFYYWNRYAIARIAPMAERHLTAITHQLWRRMRKPMWNGVQATKEGKLGARDVKSRIDPFRIYECYGHLEKTGKNYKTLCVFHGDHHPSMVVYPDGNFKCFVCGEAGDVLKYLRKVEEGRSFQEVLRIALAESS
jgi:CHC2 zinc finger